MALDRVVRLGVPALALVLCGPAASDETAARIREQEQAFAKSIVWLKLTVSDDQGNEGSSLCSGPAITKDGRTVIVAPDVPDRLQGIRILQADGKEAEAEVLAHDAEMGLMFVRPKDAGTALSPAEIRKTRAVAIGDPLLLIDRRSHTAPEETTCRMVRVNCVFSVPELLYFYSGLTPQQMGGLVVTLEGEVVGLVGLFKDRDEEGKEQQGAAVLPIEKVLAAVSAVPERKSESKAPNPEPPGR